MGKSAVLICPLFLVEYEFEMVALCRGTAKLLFTILIIFVDIRRTKSQGYE